MAAVSDVCQINEVDHPPVHSKHGRHVSDVCQINEVDHSPSGSTPKRAVSDVCQINEVDHVQVTEYTQLIIVPKS